jgi:hypothetical protein
LRNKGQILAASDNTRPALRNSGQDTFLLIRMTDQSPGDGSLNFLEIATKMHCIGQILNFLAPTQSPDVNKEYLQSTELRNIKNPQINFGSSTYEKRPESPKETRYKPWHIAQENTGKPGMKHQE